MPKSEAEIRASLDAVIEDVDTNQRIYGWFAGNVGELARVTKDLVSTFEKRFDTVEMRLDRFEANTGTQFGLVNDSLNKLDARMERLVRYVIRDERKDASPQDEVCAGE
jgi:hypothetical protein